MELNKLLVSCVNISEDDYDYRGTFTLSYEDSNIKFSSMEIDLAAFDSDEKILTEIKSRFELSEPGALIKETIMRKVMEISSLSSKDVHGENYDLDQIDDKAIST